MSISSCKILVELIALYFITFHSCIVKEEYDYLNTDPPIHKHDRCSSTAYVILRLLIGKKVYANYKNVDSLLVSRINELSTPYDSYNVLQYLKQDLFKNRKEHTFFLMKIVRYFDGKIYNQTESKHILPRHLFLIEKKSNKQQLSFNLYQSYVDDYSLLDYLNTYDSSYSSSKINDLINGLSLIFTSTKWSKKCSKIWSLFFHHKLEKTLIGLPIKNKLFFIYETFPVSFAKQNLSDFTTIQLGKLKYKKQNSLFDLPSLFKSNPHTTVKMVKDDLIQVSKILQ